METHKWSTCISSTCTSLIKVTSANMLSIIITADFLLLVESFTVLIIEKGHVKFVERALVLLVEGLTPSGDEATGTFAKDGLLVRKAHWLNVATEFNLFCDVDDADCISLLLGITVAVVAGGTVDDAIVIEGINLEGSCNDEKFFWASVGNTLLSS